MRSSLLALALVTLGCSPADFCGAGSTEAGPTTEDEATLHIDPEFTDQERADILWAWGEWERAGAPMGTIWVRPYHDDEEPWVLGRGAPGWPHVRQGIDQFAQVALHEIGHALGGTTHHEGEGVMVRFVEQGVPCVSSDDLAWIGVDGEGTCR